MGLGDRVDLGPDPVHPAQGGSDHQPGADGEQQRDDGYAEPQRPAQGRGCLVHGLETGADVHRDRPVRAVSGSGPEPIGLGLGVVRGVDGANGEPATGVEAGDR